MININKEDMLEELNRKLEKENIKNIKKKILNEEDISYKLVDSILNQYDKKIIFFDKRQSDLLVKITQRENTIYKNNIIIEKLNTVVYELKNELNTSKKCIENYSKELMDISNNFSVEKIDLEELINKKKGLIIKLDSEIVSLTKKNEKYHQTNTKLEKIIIKNTQEIYVIYKSGLYIFLLCQVYNYFEINPFMLGILTFFIGNTGIYINYRFNINIFYLLLENLNLKNLKSKILKNLGIF